MKIHKNLFIFLFALSGSFLFSQTSNFENLVGKWDLTVTSGEKIMPSWMEIKVSGIKTLVGAFVAESGSARPISEVVYSDGIMSFSIPPQWDGTNDMHFSAAIKGGKLQGHIIDHRGVVRSVEGVKAPKLDRKEPTAWSKPIALFNGKNTDGWYAQMGEDKNQWIVENGVLVNPKVGSNLITNASYDDFKLHIEFQYGPNSNSGIYLRGRYEVQVEDGYGKNPSSILFGGIYGFLTPHIMAAKKPGVWQSYDITLVGRTVTIEANGETIIWKQNIPGITGGAMDSNEGSPGPIMLQGDHGPIKFRNITIQQPEE